MKKRISLIARDQKRLYTGFLIAAVLLFLLTGFYTQFNPMTLVKNGDAFWAFITEDFLPPALPRASRISGVLSSVAVTLALAMSSTTAAAILAFFVSLFGSEKVSPFPKAAKFVRGFATFLRNIPALVWAFILFSSLGIGTGVGFVALCITSFAFMVRAFVETMEDVSQDCVESLQAVGASFPQRVAQAIVPSCLNGFLSWYLYCIEVNIRASTIVGMVGGGGLGLTLFSYIKSFEYDIALSIILLVAAMVIVVDRVTGRLRKEILAVPSSPRKSREEKTGRVIDLQREERKREKKKIPTGCAQKNRFIPGFLAACAVLSVLSLLYLEIDWLKLLMRTPEIGEVFLELARFDFSSMDVIADSMLETVSIAVLSLLYSLVLGVFFGMLAARNILRLPWLSVLIQSFFTFLRAVPTPVWVLLMLVCLGMGPEAGVAGLCVHTTAFFTKSFAQSFESIPEETIEALEATGTGRLGIFTNAVLPAAFSQIVAWTGMRLETNFSECAILGMVGAGGIGYVISRNLQGYEYGTAGLAILLVFLIAYGIERLFVRVKKLM